MACKNPEEEQEQQHKHGSDGVFAEMSTVQTPRGQFTHTHTLSLSFSLFVHAYQRVHQDICKVCVLRHDVNVNVDLGKDSSERC